MRKTRTEPSRIPTEEDFARAEAHCASQERMFATIRDHVVQSVEGRIPLHKIFLFPGPATDFEAYVFYESDTDIEACRVNGAEQTLKDVVLQVFAEMSDDTRTPPTVAFKFDSHENVKKQCNGNYGIYLK